MLEIENHVEENRLFGIKFFQRLTNQKKKIRNGGSKQ